MMTYTGPIASQAEVDRAVQALNFPRLRKLLDPNDPIFNPEYNRLAIDTANRVDDYDPTLPTPGIYKAAIANAVSGAAASAQLMEFKRSRELAEQCIYRESCGCQLARCFAHRGDHGLGNSHASIERCAACMREAWNLSK